MIIRRQPGPGAARRGIASLYAVAALIVLLAMAVLAVDFGRVMLVRSELEGAVDAACLAGAGGLPNGPAEARSRAKAIAQQNRVDGKALVLLNSDIELGTWDSTGSKFVPLTGAAEANANALRINAKLVGAKAVPLTFFSIFGRDSAKLARSAVAGFGNATDVVLVQDITSSFSDELADARIADKGLVDSLYANGTGTSMLGIAVHTGWGKTLAPLQKAKNNYTFLSQTVANLKLCGNKGMPVCSGTDIAAGLEEALKIFADPNYTSLPSKGEKVIVLVSDGEPNASTSGSHPKMTNTQLLALAQQVADQAWAQKVHVYVAFFNRSNDPSAASKVASLKRGKGVFLQTTDPKKLPTLMAEIVKQLPKQLLQ